MCVLWTRVTNFGALVKVEVPVVCWYYYIYDVSHQVSEHH